MAALSLGMFSGGAGLTPLGSAGAPSLAQALVDVGLDLATIKAPAIAAAAAPAVVGAAAANAAASPPTQAEFNALVTLTNELRTVVIALVAIANEVRTDLNTKNAAALLTSVLS